jgi:hypothetical protein
MSPDLDHEQIEKDILLIVGGDFSPDSVGPQRYKATVDRLRTAPDQYLDAVESMFLGINFNSEQQSEMSLPFLFDLISDLKPDRIRQISEKLIKHIDSTMILYDQAKDREALRSLLPSDAISLMQRLDIIRMQLRVFLN